MTTGSELAGLSAKAAELHKKGQLIAAIEAYAAVLQQHPKDAACLHGMGVATFQLHGKPQAVKATSLVKQAVNAAPGVAKYRHSLGVIYEKCDQLTAASDALEKACEKDRANIRYRLDYARVLKVLDQPARAAEVYATITQQLDPAHPTAHYKEACAWRVAGRQERAAAAFKRHLELQPDHEQARFWYAALTSSTTLTACPADMVAGLFDQYADHFDEHLVNKLGYATPQLLLNLLLEAAEPSPRWRCCLDLGCGTGLMGPLLRPHVSQLAGVDLSAGMVDKARERGCYDQVEVGELVEYLQAHATGPGAAADLLVAADVFVYIGDLQPVFHAATACSSTGAMFLFSTEYLSSSSTSSTSSSLATAFQLQPTGRFAHSAEYLRQLGQATGWKVLALQEQQVLRYNAGAPILGNLCVMQRV